MPTPTRPVDDATIETDWGQRVHDYTFAPAGCIVRSPTYRSIGTTITTLYLDTVDEDPGGYLDAANDRVVIPTDGAGLYQAIATYITDNGDAGEETKVFLYLNGSQIAKGSTGNEGSTAIWDQVVWAGVLAAGDILQYKAQKTGGANPDVRISSAVIIRLGAEVGAP